MRTSLPRTLLAAFSGLGALKLLSLALGSVASIFIARSLGPSGYGEVTFVFAVLSLLSIPSGSAMSPLLVRYVAAYHHSKDWARLRSLLDWTARQASSLAVALMLLAFACSAWLLAVEQGARGSLFLVGAPVILLWSWSARVAGELQGLNNVVLAQSFDWVVNPGIYLCLISGLWFAATLTPTLVVACSALALLVSTAAGRVVLGRIRPREVAETRERLRDPAWNGVWRRFVAIQAVGTASMQLPVLLLGVLAVEAETGLFRASENVASLLSIGLLVFNVAFAPHVSRLHASGSTGELSRIAKGSARAALAVTLPAALCVFAFGESILSIVFGSDFASAYPTLVVLTVGQIVNVACGSVGLLLNMTGHEDRSLRVLGLSLLLNAALGILLVPSHGAIGAAIASAASLVFWNVLLLVQTKRRLGIDASAF